MKKIDWEKFFEAYNTLRKFEKEDLKKVDLSELFEGDPTEALEMHYFSGLMNKDFITSDITMKKGLKRKFVLDKKGLRFRSEEH
ncbi:MAG TPA: hypothetical protein VMR76_01005 [Candidatus Saccharimonadia bacterium]|nr:hypothetical protein [Candidatus Saccharimonadia bacterium]